MGRIRMVVTCQVRKRVAFIGHHCLLLVGDR